MRHGSAISEELHVCEEARLLPDGALLARRLIAFARVAAAMHAESAEPTIVEAEHETDLSLASLLGIDM